MIIFQPYPMGRMKYLWREDAETFSSKRWLNENGVFVLESPFKFTAFQAGPSIYLGKEFAYRQMKIFTATLLCFLKFKLWDENKPINYKSMLTLQIDEDSIFVYFIVCCKQERSRDLGMQGLWKGQGWRCLYFEHR